MLFLYCLLAAAFFMDIWKERIPNLLIVTGCLAGAGYALAGGTLWYLSVLDGIAILILLYPFFLIGAFGGGDVKLLSVVGMFLGTETTINIILTAIMAGAVCSVVKIAFLLLQKKKIPFSRLYIHFSLPIFLGTILTHLGGITWITF